MLFDDKAIKTSKGNLKMFPNSFQPKRIPVPVSSCPPAISLEYVSQSPWNHCQVSLEWKLTNSEGEWEKKWCWQQGRKCFFQFRARSKCWHRLPCVWGQWHMPMVTRSLFRVPCSETFGKWLQKPQLLTPHPHISEPLSSLLGITDCFHSVSQASSPRVNSLIRLAVRIRRVLQRVSYASWSANSFSLHNFTSSLY